jgi:acyl-CoA thioesterase YciA
MGSNATQPNAQPKGEQPKGEQPKGEQPKGEQPRGELSLRTVAMPADTNPNGDIFGGWIMSLMDLAAGTAAGSRAKGRVATAAVSNLSFLQPVKVGDVVCVYTDVVRTGRTSITLSVEVYVLRQNQGDRVRVTAGEFVLVAVDANGRPRALPGSG